MRRIRRRREFALILLHHQRYHLFETNTGPGPLRSFTYDGHPYEMDASSRRVLRGYWHPLDRIGFFSDLLARDGITRHLTIFPKPDPQRPGPIRPIDRLEDILPADALTPHVHRAWFVSSLYRDRMRRLKIGVVNLRTVLIVFAVLGVILGILYFSGYLTG